MFRDIVVVRKLFLMEDKDMLILHGQYVVCQRSLNARIQAEIVLTQLSRS